MDRYCLFGSLAAGISFHWEARTAIKPGSFKVIVISARFCQEEMAGAVFIGIPGKASAALYIAIEGHADTVGCKTGVHCSITIVCWKQEHYCS